MAYRLKVSARALREVGAAYDWYEDQQPGLGQEFLTAVEVSLSRLLEFPDRHSLVRPGVRRALLDRFPYGVYFAVKSDLISVLGVVHGARSPRRWPRRNP